MAESAGEKALCTRRFVGKTQKLSVRHARCCLVKGEREHGDAVYVGQTREDSRAARRAPEAIGAGSGAPGGTGKCPAAHPAACLSGKQRKAGQETDAPT